MSKRNSQNLKEEISQELGIRNSQSENVKSMDSKSCRNNSISNSRSSKNLKNSRSNNQQK